MRREMARGNASEISAARSLLESLLHVASPAGAGVAYDVFMTKPESVKGIVARRMSVIRSTPRLARLYAVPLRFLSEEVERRNQPVVEAKPRRQVSLRREQE